MCRGEKAYLVPEQFKSAARNDGLQWKRIHRLAQLSFMTFPGGNPFPATGMMLDFFRDISLSSWWFARAQAIPGQVPGDQEEAVRRGGASPSPLIRFCSVSNTATGMIFKQLIWQRLVTAGSPASSSEVNCVSLHIFRDVSEWANSTLLLSNRFSALKKSAWYFSRCPY